MPLFIAMQSRDISKIFRFTATLSLCTLLALLLGIYVEYDSIWQVGVIFLMPVLWTLWIACVVFHRVEARMWTLVLLWLLIDSIALSYMRLALGSFQGVDPKGGSELVWLIEFSPPILLTVPLGFLPELFAMSASKMILPAGSVGVLKDWLELSISSAIPSFAFMILWCYRKAVKSRSLDS